MDQARWLVVFSVIICMTGVLTILHRLSATSRNLPGIEQGNTLQPAVNISANKVEHLKTDPVRRKYGRIKFSRPPAHTFAVEGSGDFSRIEAAGRDAGRILK
jgi:hypothetical protein